MKTATAETQRGFLTVLASDELSALRTGAWDSPISSDTLCQDSEISNLASKAMRVIHYKGQWPVETLKEREVPGLGLPDLKGRTNTSRLCGERSH